MTKKTNRAMRRKLNAPQPKLEIQQGKIHVVNLSSYTRPEISERYNQEWIECFYSLLPLRCYD